MCKYYKKMFTCGHLSEVYVDRCLPACAPGNEACTTTSPSHDPEVFKKQLRQAARPSHFACFNCLKAAAHAELSASAEAAAAAESDPAKRAEIATTQARYASKAAKADANRAAAEEKMRAERERDRVAVEARKAEDERAARGEGTWIETGSARRKRGRHGRGFRVAEGPVQSAPPTPTFRMGVDAGVGGRAGKMGEVKGEPRSANEVDAGSGVGAWPKKILAKGEKQRESWGWK